MRTNEIYTAEISWPGGSKRRPVLIIEEDDKSVSVFRITSKYKNKTNYIKHFYYPIVDWESSGLRKQSYIDTKTVQYLDKTDISFYRVGVLSANDRQGLKEFLENL